MRRGQRSILEWLWIVAVIVPLGIVGLVIAAPLWVPVAVVIVVVLAIWWFLVRPLAVTAIDSGLLGRAVDSMTRWAQRHEEVIVTFVLALAVVVGVAFIVWTG